MANKQFTHKYTVIDSLLNEVEATHTGGADNLKAYIDTKQAALVVGTNLDSAVTSESTNPITSGGVFTAMFGNYYQGFVGEGEAPNNDNLNLYRRPGAWYASSTAAANVANTPYTTGVFKLEVFITYQSSSQIKFIQRIWIGGARYFMRGGTTYLTGTNAGKTGYNNWFEYAGSDTGSGTANPSVIP